MKTTRFLLSLGVTLLAAWPAFADAPNLIQNGDFEQRKDGVPVGWNHTPVQAELIEVAFPGEQERGTVAQVELLHSGSKGAYFSQAVKVEPHKHYRLSLLARLNKGKITVAVIGAGKDGSKKLNLRLLGEPSTRLPMAPLFWDADWYKNLSFIAGQWRPVTLEFDSGDLTQIYVSFGAYFTAGEYSFDDVTLVELPGRD